MSQNYKIKFYHIWKVLTGSAIMLSKDLKNFLEENGYRIEKFETNVKEIPGQTGISYFKGTIIGYKPFFIYKCKHIIYIIISIILFIDAILIYNYFNNIYHHNILYGIGKISLLFLFFVNLQHVSPSQLIVFTAFISIFIFLIKMLFRYKLCNIRSIKMHIHDLLFSLFIIYLLISYKLWILDNMGDLISIDSALWLILIGQFGAILWLLYNTIDNKHLWLLNTITIEGEMYRLERDIGKEASTKDLKRRLGLVSELNIKTELSPAIMKIIHVGETNTVIYYDEDEGSEIIMLLSENDPVQYNKLKEKISNEFNNIKNKLDKMIPKYEIPGHDKNI